MPNTTRCLNRLDPSNVLTGEGLHRENLHFNLNHNTPYAFYLTQSIILRLNPRSASQPVSPINPKQ